MLIVSSHLYCACLPMCVCAEDVTLRLIAERVLPDAVGKTYVDREIISQPLQPLPPPKSSARNGGSKRSRQGRMMPKIGASLRRMGSSLRQTTASEDATQGQSHLYCSPNNVGAKQLILDLAASRGCALKWWAERDTPGARCNSLRSLKHARRDTRGVLKRQTSSGLANQLARLGLSKKFMHKRSTLVATMVRDCVQMPQASSPLHVPWSNVAVSCLVHPLSAAGR